MTELEARKKVVKVMESWVGLNEADESFKTIIDTYNKISPRPRGVKLSYTSPWCAATVSAAFSKAGMLSIGFAECSCSKMIELYKKADCWEEDDSVTPQIGDLVMYDWNDSGKGNNKGAPDHVGIVSEVDGKSFVVIEGNMGDGVVGKRNMKVNGKNIRGFCMPDYGKIADGSQEFTMVQVEAPLLKQGMKGDPIYVLQTLLEFHGYDPKGVDGSFGAGCAKAVKNFQSAHGLEQDGSVGPLTWAELIGG